MSQLPPRNPNDGFVFMLVGLTFWLSILLVVPTLAEWATSWL